ncbi:cobalamin-dependent protein [Desulfosporosinus sp. PR]|uniref:cobalamin B12-binding domain-containing protein n=1 Tax=Candidatus Desulfosporosinus nitrosoreducens TaxID=3401928 RepID=UPI0027EB1FD5|nr:cobalamin-dependent protein [Desulfosporosinus sp. PR]MDQ7093570.1 cobalamin-dependent protein [Desulfosporosinus sp. PR]
MGIKNNVEEFKARKLLAHAMGKLDEDTVLNLVRQGLEQGVDSLEMIAEARSGMEKVGELYDAGKYFLCDLMVGAEIFTEAINLVLKSSHIEPVSDVPPIVFGTVGGDIHDIGKNIMISVLKSKGCRVLDLGVDVAAATFIEAIKTTGSRLLCLSGLITTAYDSMKKIVDLLEKEGLRSKVLVVIGGLVNDAVKNYTGADYWVTDCARGADLCMRIMDGCPRKQEIAYL